MGIIRTKKSGRNPAKRPTVAFRITRTVGGIVEIFILFVGRHYVTNYFSGWAEYIRIECRYAVVFANSDQLISGVGRRW